MAISRFRLITQLFKRPQLSSIIQTENAFHTSSIQYVPSSPKDDEFAPKNWLKFNDIVYPPQKLGEEPRPAYVVHQKSNIKYSPYKMWYIACLIRGMSLDEAITQLKFVAKKGAKHVCEALEEAKELAIKEHNVEFGSNMWVAESFVGKGQVIKGMRRHARMRAGHVSYIHCHYFLRLEEGKPPKDYYVYSAAKGPSQQLQEWLEQLRRRKITNSL